MHSNRKHHVQRFTKATKNDPKQAQGLSTWPKTSHNKHFENRKPDGASVKGKGSRQLRVGVQPSAAPLSCIATPVRWLRLPFEFDVRNTRLTFTGFFD